MFGEIIAAHNDRHPTRDLAHGLEQREAAIHLHRLIGNGSTTGLHQRLCKMGIWSKVQVGKQHLALAEEVRFFRLRFLNFHDEFRF